MKKFFTLPSVALILLVAAFIALADNTAFWSSLSQRLDLFDLKGFGFALTFYSLITGIVALILLLFGQKFLLKPLLVLFLIVSALVGYFNSIGVVFDDSMISNMLETVKDRNTNEAAELVSVSLLWHLFLYGLLPSAFVLAVKVHYKKPLGEAFTRLAVAVGVVVVIGALVMLNYKYLTFFSRENRDLRLTITPIYPMTSVAKLIRKSHAGDEVPFRVIGDDAVQAHAGKKRVGIMVVGETARADHFSLNGYTRDTNPLLAKQDIVSYPDAWSCGTSTAYSVPCMFSFLGRKDYSPAKAGKQSNVLDVLEKAGVKTVWRDNNSSCKGVCERIETQNFHHDFDPESPFFNQDEYIDQILLEKLDDLIDKTPGDVLVVFHTMGSHGPAYYKRYPKAFARFQPECASNSPHECDTPSVINAYDNTIIYTDFVLNKTIDFLKARADQYDSFMLYASDHGESLGEKGVYLHGLPYLIAPDAQKHVPVIAWLSDGLKRSEGLAAGAEKACEKKPVSHDNLVHTLLGLFDVKTGLYDKRLDLFGGCPA